MTKKNTTFKITREVYDLLVFQVSTLISLCQKGNIPLQQQEVYLKEIRQLNEQINNAVIIDISELDDNQVNINDTLLLRMIYDIDDVEEDTYTIVAGEGNIKKNQISINTPVDRAIFRKRVGDVVSCIPESGEPYQVMIMQKLKSLQR